MNTYSYHNRPACKTADDAEALINTGLEWLMARVAEVEKDLDELKEEVENLNNEVSDREHHIAQLTKQLDAV